MPTPLETWLANHATVTSATALAVGADNAHSTALRDGVVAVSPVAAGTYTVPQTFAGHLAVTGNAWNEDANYQYIRDVTGDPANPPIRCHVFHPSLVAALRAASVGNGDIVDIPAFVAAFKGNRRYTYTEVTIILAAGYTRVTHYTAGVRITLEKP